VTPLPAPLLGGRGPLVAWRIDAERFAASWDSGEGARLLGGRWNTREQRAVYAAFDPATAILEVAVHKGFRVFDKVPHVISSFIIANPADVHATMPASIPDPAWLHPSTPTSTQQAFGETLLRRRKFVALPSVVSPMSWNLVFDPVAMSGRYMLDRQQPFTLDPRLVAQTR
jgi:RES domain-containing protein